jgi:hypothetical protein
MLPATSGTGPYRPMVDEVQQRRDDAVPPTASATNACEPWRTPAQAAAGGLVRLGHELRTPLNAILGNVELLLAGSAGPLSAAARGCLDEVQSAGRQLNHEIPALLLLVQTLVPDVPGARAPVDFGHTLRRAFRRQGRSSALPGDALADGRLVVTGDPHWLNVLASTMVELASAVAPKEGELLVHDLGQPGRMGLRLVWRAARPQPPLAALAVIESILQMHDGEVKLEAGNALSVSWPVPPTADPACAPAASPAELPVIVTVGG